MQNIAQISPIGYNFGMGLQENLSRRRFLGLAGTALVAPHIASCAENKPDQSRQTETQKNLANKVRDLELKQGFNPLDEPTARFYSGLIINLFKQTFLSAPDPDTLQRELNIYSGSPKPGRSPALSVNLELLNRKGITVKYLPDGSTAEAPPIMKLRHQLVGQILEHIALNAPKRPADGNLEYSFWKSLVQHEQFNPDRNADTADFDELSITHTGFTFEYRRTSGPNVKLQIGISNGIKQAVLSYLGVKFSEVNGLTIINSGYPYEYKDKYENLNNLFKESGLEERDILNMLSNSNLPQFLGSISEKTKDLFYDPRDNIAFWIWIFERKLDTKRAVDNLTSQGNP